MDQNKPDSSGKTVMDSVAQPSSDLTIIITTFNRPQMVLNAVHSALNQTLESVEVLVVDDGSDQKPELPDHPRLRLLTLEENKGVARARNAGARAARTRWITFLDDDDTVLPEMAALSLEAACSDHGMELPVAVLSGLEIVGTDGKVIETHLPYTLPKGAHYSLEPPQPGKSIYCKQTVVIEREVYLGFGGCDEHFGSRVYSELFFRLNAACSLYGIPQITYRLLQHNELRITRNPMERQLGFKRLLEKHGRMFAQYPSQFSWYYRDHALRSFREKQYREAFLAALNALRWDFPGSIRGLFERGRH